MQARFIQDGTAVDYIPETDVAAGTVVVEGDLVGITKVDIPANRLGALHLFGAFDVVKSDGPATLGAKVYWDNTAKQAVTRRPATNCSVWPLLPPRPGTPMSAFVSGRRYEYVTNRTPMAFGETEKACFFESPLLS